MRRVDRIRKLCHVLVLGGAMAAGCSKDEPKAAPTPVAPTPAAPTPAAPTPAAPTPAAPETAPAAAPPTATPSVEPAGSGDGADPAATTQRGDKPVFRHRRHHRSANGSGSDSGGW
jgi:hypothetical protein